MQTRTHAPMLGALTVDRWGKSLRRHDRPTNPDWQRLQVRTARRLEAALIAADLADERAPVLELAHPSEADNDWASYLADVNADADPFGYDEHECMCRRCFLHDDPGGCEVADLRAEQAHAAYLDEQADLSDSADEVFLAQHELGYGDTFDPDDIQWGFRVTDAHKAPGVTSGRPVPASLANQ